MAQCRESYSSGEWERNGYKTIILGLVCKISIIALLTTLIGLFSFQGNIILSDTLLVAYLAAPNLLHYVTMIGILFSVSWLSNWSYLSSIDATIIGSSSHFEVAIAVAIILYGPNSGAALATVIGPLMDVSLMLARVRFGLRTRHVFPKKKELAIVFHILHT